MTSISFATFSISTTALAASTPRSPAVAAPAVPAEPARPRSGERQSVLAGAMLQALGQLGWTAPSAEASATTPAAADPAAVPPAAPAAAPDLGDAVAAFAHALWGALRGGRGGDSDDGDSGRHGHHHDHDHGRRAHGWGRSEQGYQGLAPRLERLIARYGDAAPAQPPASAPATPDAPVAPAVDVAPVEPVAAPLPAPLPVEAGTPAISGTDTAATAPTPGTVVVDTAPAPRRDWLVQAFEGLIAALRDTGVGVPAQQDPESTMVDFLRGLADALRPSSRGTLMDAPMGSPLLVTGSFIRITV